MSNNQYDSRIETLKHVQRVQELVKDFSRQIRLNVEWHDQTKLADPEKSLFDTHTPLLKNCTYGSDLYKQYLNELKVALDHHYQYNGHHPEHYPNGVDGMTLYDIVEMFMDWVAAGERHADGNIYKSIEHNKTRFKLSPQLVSILVNTANAMESEK